MQVDPKINLGKEYDSPSNKNSLGWDAAWKDFVLFGVYGSA